MNADEPTPTLVHPLRGEAEYVLTVFCDDPSHEERVISTLGYWPKPPGRVGFLRWLEGVHTDPDQPPALQTPFGEKRAAQERAGAETVDLGGPAGLPRGMDYETRWRFECRGCCTLPVNGLRMEEILERLRVARVPRISLPQLAARLNT